MTNQWISEQTLAQAEPSAFLSVLIADVTGVGVRVTPHELHGDPGYLVERVEPAYANAQDPDDPTWKYYDEMPLSKRLQLVDVSGKPMYLAGGARFPYALVPKR